MGNRVTTRVICLRNFTGSARGGSRLVRRGHVSFAEGSASKSQREVVTTGQLWTRNDLAPGTLTRVLMGAKRSRPIFSAISPRNGEKF